VKKIERVIISVSNKTGMVEFAKGLHAMGVEIISTGGTAKTLRDAGVTVKEVAEHTGSPEMLDGRVKTLHPRVHGGLLARRGHPKDMEEIRKNGIELIDLVAVNLYPFEETISKVGVTFAEAIENIDIGGPAMLRSASKNLQDVVVIIDPGDYGKILEEMRISGGYVVDKTRLQLAQKVFQHTSRYDGLIADYLAKKIEEDVAAGGGQ
jgi:phosphoribosylaminoimidazolecarboxamide formyltransferase / IMP cyclohydrolase